MPQHKQLMWFVIRDDTVVEYVTHAWLCRIAMGSERGCSRSSHLTTYTRTVPHITMWILELADSALTLEEDLDRLLMNRNLNNRGGFTAQLSRDTMSRIDCRSKSNKWSKNIFFRVVSSSYSKQPLLSRIRVKKTWNCLCVVNKDAMVQLTTKEQMFRCPLNKCQGAKVLS